MPVEQICARCQAYASGPMSVPEVSHDNCPQKNREMLCPYGKKYTCMCAFRKIGKEWRYRAN